MNIQDEYEKLSSRFNDNFSLFYIAEQLSRLNSNPDIETCRVQVNIYDNKPLSIEVNPKWWKQWNDEEKAFIIGHEYLHVLNYHAVRGFSVKNKIRANIAADIVVNETLLADYGFHKDKIVNLWKTACCVEKFFPDEPTNESLEYYYNKLTYEDETDTLDDHSNFGEMSAQEEQLLQEQITKIVENLSTEEQQQLQTEFNQLTNNKGNGQKTFTFTTKKTSRQWLTLIKRAVKIKSTTQETWLYRNRKHETLSTELFLPNDLEREEKKQYHVVFFLDTSGSCTQYSERFVELLQTLPYSTVKFEVFGFDTEIYPINLKANKIKLQGFGGTSFSILEEFINKKYLTYPKYVFVVTDGWGDEISPKYPQNWHWFLVKDSTEQHIPDKSNIHSLKDFL